MIIALLATVYSALPMCHALSKYVIYITSSNLHSSSVSWVLQSLRFGDKDAHAQRS